MFVVLPIPTLHDIYAQFAKEVYLEKCDCFFADRGLMMLVP